MTQLEKVTAAYEEVSQIANYLYAENKRLEKALQDLYDEQNDAPLERRRPEWEMAMENARKALIIVTR